MGFERSAFDLCFMIVDYKRLILVKTPSITGKNIWLKKRGKLRRGLKE